MIIYTHTVYWIHLPEHNDILTHGYVGVSNNPKRRLSEHKNVSKIRNDKNPYFGRILNKYSDKIILTIIFCGDEDACYSLEECLRPEKNIGWNANKGGNKPPNKKGWKPSKSTLEKRSQSLKGVHRSKDWCNKLSLAKQGKNNPMYGRKNACSEDKQMAIIKTKNLPNYSLYKKAIEMMDKGMSADSVSNILGIGRGVCFRLKNKTHLFFKAFPELKQIKTS